MIGDNLAKYSLVDLKCICCDTFQHSSIPRVGFVKQLACVQTICPHAEYLSCWRAFQPQLSMPYRDYCWFGNIFNNLLRCILAQRKGTASNFKHKLAPVLFVIHLIVKLLILKQWDVKGKQKRKRELALLAFLSTNRDLNNISSG